MKISARIAWMVPLAVGWSALAGAPAAAADLLVEVVNVPATGSVYVSLYDTPATFLRKPAAAASKVANADKVEFVFKDLPAGNYAASAFLDSNSNKKLDTNSMGIPIEPNGISRAAKGRTGPPAFDDAAFELRGDSTRVTITLKK
jgi:uncharacterized protein (DUF2141 family)